MPEKPLTIAAYAAGASLAAATLVYVFGPTYFFDDEAAMSSRSARKKGVVGLSNPANDCFINSVLQALAGLPELRLYLIREMHRRKLDGAALYEDLAAALEEQEQGKSVPEWKVLGLQRGLVTAGLKDVLDALNERPIYKKTISAQGFIRVVEEAFKTRVSRYQQDAQEFLQIVTERLADEHHAGRRVRRKARRKTGGGAVESSTSGLEVSKVDEELEKSEETIKPKKSAATDSVTAASGAASSDNASAETDSDRVDSGTEITAKEEDDDEIEPTTFPLEGKIESQIECSHCHFKPKPAVSSFVTMTLNVPHDSTSTTLNACFDGMLKVEHIDDYKCDRCRLEHALQVIDRQLAKTSLKEQERSKLASDRDKLQTAIEEDPEEPPKDVQLPDSASAPKRRITRHMRISTFPRVLAIHLSRSVWDRHSISTKNMAKVAFPETLPLGGLLDRKTYRLLSVVTHKGGHNSGHYETFRRQWLSPPYSTPANMGKEGIFSLQASPAASPYMSAAPSPRLGGRSLKETPSPADLTSSPSGSSHRFSLERRKTPTSVPFDAIPTPGLPSLPLEKSESNQSQQLPRKQSTVGRAMSGMGKKRKPQDRWWRISDDKIKEGKTSDVMGMQREVYLLFYEMVDPEE